jgi:hypothetical protein
LFLANIISPINRIKFLPLNFKISSNKKMAKSMTDTAFGRGLTKTTRDQLKNKQQTRQKEIESIRESLDDFMKDQNSGEVLKNSNKLTKNVMFNVLKLSIIAIMITAITLMIIFGLSKI